MFRILAVVAVLTLALTGCGEADEPATVAGSAPTPVSLTVPEGTEGVTVTPAVAAPGEDIELRFDRPGQVRGIAWSLADESGIVYYLTSSVYGEGEPSWWSVADSEGRGWVDVGVGGPGPDLLTVPDTAAPGDYLLCSENSLHRRCATLSVAP